MSRGRRGNSGHHKASSRKFSENKAQAQLEKYPLTHPCPDCGKYRYMTRRGAKLARTRTKQNSWDQGAMSVYRCGEYWHVGHTPKQIRIGHGQRANVANEATGWSRQQAS